MIMVNECLYCKDNLPCEDIFAHPSCRMGTIDFGGNSQSSTCFWWQSKGLIVAHTRDSKWINRANWSLQVGNFIPFEVLNTLKQWPMKEHLDNYFAYMPLPSHRPSSFALCFSSILFYVGKSNLLKTFRGQDRICIWLKTTLFNICCQVQCIL